MASNRRSFIKKSALPLRPSVPSPSSSPHAAEAQSSSPTATELAVLNFALNLEYLEAEFYTYGEFGYGFEQAGIGISGVATGANPATGGSTSGGSKVTFSNNPRLLPADPSSDRLR